MSLPTMIGSEGPAYKVVSETPLGIIGFRNIDDGRFRIRVIPHDAPALAQFLTESKGWTQPKGSQKEFRYSKVVKTQQALVIELASLSAYIHCQATK